MKRILSVALSLCLTAGLLSGCKGQDQDQGGKPTGGTATAMGRYVEEKGEALTDLSGIYGLFRTGEGDIVFYSSKMEPGTYSPTVYRNVLDQTDGTVTATEVPGIAAAMGGIGMVSDISESLDGTVYVMYMGAQGNSLLRSTDGQSFEALTMSDWANPMDSGSVVEPEGGASVSSSGSVSSGGSVSVGGSADVSSDTSDVGDISFSEDDEVKSGVFVAGDSDTGKYPSGVMALDGGEFLVSYGEKGAAKYNAQLEPVAEFLGQAYGGRLAVHGGKLLIGAGDSTLALYDMSTGNQIGTFTFENMSFLVSAGLDDTGVYLGDSTGIYRQGEKGSVWEKLVDGDLTSLSMPTIALSALVSDGGDGFWGLLERDREYQVVHYVYSPDTPTTPDTELTIFGLQDNNTVRQAIGEFQRQNPNVRVNFRVMQPEGSGATTEDIIRALNTELLGGKGPDLLLLDGLPAESYIEKGVLIDITGLVRELTETHGVSSNLTNAYEREGKIYGVPTRFAVPIILGRASELDLIGSLTDLVDQVEAKQGGEPPLMTTPTDLWDENGEMLLKYYDACSPAWMKDDGSIDQAALADYFADMTRMYKTLDETTAQNDGFVISTIVSAGGGSSFEAADMGVFDVKNGKALLHTTTLSSALDMDNILYLLENDGGAQVETLFGGTKYVPKGSVGLVATGKQQDLARAFLEMLLSQTVQDEYLYDGLPVNGKSLDKMIQKTMDERELTSDYGLRALCAKVNDPVLLDQVILEAARAQAKALIDGTITPEEAAAKVVESTELYRAE